MRTRITMSAARCALAVVPNLAGAGAKIGGPTGIVIAQRDGTPGNPPSTATGRTVDRRRGRPRGPTAPPATRPAPRRAAPWTARSEPAAGQGPRAEGRRRAVDPDEAIVAADGSPVRSRPEDLAGADPAHRRGRATGIVVRLAAPARRKAKRARPRRRRNQRREEGSTSWGRRSGRRRGAEPGRQSEGRGRQGARRHEAQGRGQARPGGRLGAQRRRRRQGRGARIERGRAGRNRPPAGQVETLMRDRVSLALSDAAGGAGDYAQRAKDVAVRQGGYAAGVVKENPLVTVGLVAAVAFLLGRLTGPHGAIGAEPGAGACSASRGSSRYGGGVPGGIAPAPPAGPFLRVAGRARRRRGGVRLVHAGLAARDGLGGAGRPVGSGRGGLGVGRPRPGPVSGSGVASRDRTDAVADEAIAVRNPRCGAPRSRCRPSAAWCALPADGCRPGVARGCSRLEGGGRASGVAAGSVPRGPRAEDRGAEAHMRGAAADRRFEVAAHAHAQHGQAVPRGQFREEAEMRARILLRGRDAHQAADRQAVLVAAKCG